MKYKNKEYSPMVDGDCAAPANTQCNNSATLAVICTLMTNCNWVETLAPGAGEAGEIRRTFIRVVGPIW